MEFNEVVMEEKMNNELVGKMVSADRTDKVLQEFIELEERVEEIKMITCHSNANHFKS